MHKRLSAIGNSFGIVIDKPILDLLDIDRDTDLDMTTDGERLIIEPIRRRRRRRVSHAADRAMVANEETMKKLAR